MKALPLLLLLLLGCSKDESNPITPPPAPTLTGTWNCTLTGNGTTTATLVLNQADTTLAGTLRFTTGYNVVLTGSCSSVGAVRMTSSMPPFLWRMQATANTDRNRLDGRLDVDSANVYMGWFSLYGVKP